jgi:AAA+ superfamily predicted ATPase
MKAKMSNTSKITEKKDFNTMSEKEYSLQESLNFEFFTTLIKDRISVHRPSDSLSDLISWTRKFLNDSEETENLVTLIHNKISIDGSFVRYAKENNIEINCLFHDALTSWKNEFENEQFIATGGFKITYGDCVFYHFALFHKGNQYEDEVSFFINVENKHLEAYIKIRDSFEKWQTERERNNKEIEVIGGAPISYDTDISWDDLIMPDEIKATIRGSVEGFLNSKHIYEKMKVPHRRGLGFWGPRGSGKTTCLKILMAQYPQLKPVTIQPGHNNPDDLLEEAFEYAEDHAPCLLFLEDLQELVKTIDLRHFLQLLDGVQKRDGILTIVTGNDFSELEENLKSRPRRFDRFIEFPFPDLDHTKKYFEKHFSDMLSDKDILELSKKSIKNKLTYAHLQEVYFNSVFIAIPNGREKPTKKDVVESLSQVINEKKVVDADFLDRKRDLTDEEDDYL